MEERKYFSIFNDNFLLLFETRALYLFLTWPCKLYVTLNLLLENKAKSLFFLSNTHCGRVYFLPWCTLIQFCLSGLKKKKKAWNTRKITYAEAKDSAMIQDIWLYEQFKSNFCYDQSFCIKPRLWQPITNWSRCRELGADMRPLTTH